MRTYPTSFTAIAVAILAVACGGGGDGGGGSDVTPPPPTSVLISETNQDTVARASLASIMPFLSVPVAPSAFPPSAPAPRGGLSQLALRSIKSSVWQPTPAGMARPLAVYRETGSCMIAGTMTVVLDDKDNNGTISAGDSTSMSFKQCDNGLGSILNGGLGMAIASYSTSASAEDIAGSMTFESLSMVDPTGSLSMNGAFDFNIKITQTEADTITLGTFTVGSAGLTVSKQGGSDGFSDTFSYRAGYGVSDRDFISKVPGAASWEVLSANGTFGSATLGGDLSLTTMTPFRSVFTDPTGDIFPTEGQLIAIGRGNTKLGLTATETVYVRMDMCDDGDEVWEKSKMVTWDWMFQ